MEQDKNPVVLRIEDQQSLIHLGSLDSFDITEGGTDAAKAILSYFDNGKKKELEKAISIYEEIIPNENFGGEYTALEWLCRFFLAPEPAQKDLLAQPFTKAFYEMMSQDDFSKRFFRILLTLPYYIDYCYYSNGISPDISFGRRVSRRVARRRFSKQSLPISSYMGSVVNLYSSIIFFGGSINWRLCMLSLLICC